MKIFKLLSIAISIVLLSGCAATVKHQQSKRPAEFSKFLRGTVYAQDTEYKLRLCGSHTVVDLYDVGEQILARIYKDGDYIPSIYMEFKARAVNTVAWEVEDIYFVSHRPNDCGLSTEKLEYLVYGVDGKWKAKVSSDTVKIEQNDLYVRLEFSSLANSQDNRRGKITLPNNITYAMTLETQNKECVDYLQQWYKRSAKLILNGRKYDGCLRESVQAHSFVSGKYSNYLEASQAFVVLNINEDKSARLILDSRSGHPLIVSHGQWSMLDNQVLSLVFQLGNDAAETTVMLFQVFDNQELKLKGFSEILGKPGLKLLPVE